jgi:putative transposase
VLEIANSPEYASAPPAQIVNDLLEKGIYIASESTFYRILRKHRQINHRGRTAAPVKRPITTHKADGPNQLWSWDITYICGPAKGLFYYLYLIIDLYSRKIVGWEIYDEESGELASEVVTKAVLSEKIRLADKPLILHADNGSPMKSATLRATMEKLGVLFSHSRPRVSNDNPYSESIFKTLKYRPAFPSGGFKDIEDARAWTYRFVSWYNHTHRHSALNYVTPEQRHKGKAPEILAKRKKTLEEAKRKHPDRWRNRPIRNCSIEETVYLNPEKESQEKRRD